MFFVAESISACPEEFKAAVLRFIGALRAGAPFAAAFMERSAGYDVGDIRFPAVSVGEDGIRSILEPVAAELHLKRIGIDGDALRDGYEGMIVVCGRVGAA